MSGVETYQDPVTGCTFRGFWNVTSLEMPDLRQLAGVVAQTRANHPCYPPGQNQTDVWSPYRSDVGAIAQDSGLTYQSGLMELNARILVEGGINGGLVGHEAGHWLHWGTSLFNGTDWGAVTMRGQWTNIRGGDCTAATPPVERFAEDFRALFGVPGVKGTTSPLDDGRRKPWDVPGLLAWMSWFPAVLGYWRRAGGIEQPSFDPASGAWIWLRRWWWVWTRWECCIGGRFEYWSGYSWIEFQP